MSTLKKQILTNKDQVRLIAATAQAILPAAHPDRPLRAFDMSNPICQCQVPSNLYTIAREYVGHEYSAHLPCVASRQNWGRLRYIGLVSIKIHILDKPIIILI